MAKLNPQIYRDAADYYLWPGPQSKYSPAERLAIGACEAIRRACAYRRTSNVYAYLEYFLMVMRRPRFAVGYNWPFSMGQVTNSVSGKPSGSWPCTLWRKCWRRNESSY